MQVRSDRTLLEALRRLCWRRRRSLAVAYFLTLVGICGSLWAYVQYASPADDLGATVVLRSLSYQQTFEEIEKARADLAEGQPLRAEQRLEAFLEQHKSTQPAQLRTHAMADAHELLAEIYLADGRPQRALRTLKTATQRTPRSWWLWYLRGQAADKAGDIDDATDSLRQAFLQSLVVPDLTEDLLGILTEQGLHEEVLWTFDQFERAQQRCAPFVQIRAGPPRSSIHRRVMRMADINVEHGFFRGVAEVHDLARGNLREFSIPVELLEPLTANEEQYLQMRFQNVFTDLQLSAFIVEYADGREVEVSLIDAEQDGSLQRMHRAHSGGDLYLEWHGVLPFDESVDVRVRYSCPELDLSRSTRALVANAKRNISARSPR